MGEPREKPTYEEVVEALEDVLWQACGEGHGPDDFNLDSLALSSYADGIHLLARLGRVEIVADYGRRVIARPVRRGE